MSPADFIANATSAITSMTSTTASAAPKETETPVNYDSGRGGMYSPLPLPLTYLTLHPPRYPRSRVTNS